MKNLGIEKEVICVKNSRFGQALRNGYKCENFETGIILSEELGDDISHHGSPLYEEVTEISIENKIYKHSRYGNHNNFSFINKDELRNVCNDEIVSIYDEIDKLKNQISKKEKEIMNIKDTRIMLESEGRYYYYGFPENLIARANDLDTNSSYGSEIFERFKNGRKEFADQIINKDVCEKAVNHLHKLSIEELKIITSGMKNSVQQWNDYKTNKTCDFIALIHNEYMHPSNKQSRILEICEYDL